MVNYLIDTTSSIKTLDAIAHQTYNQIVDELSQNRTLSDFCKSRLVDFTCAAEFQECPESIDEPEVMLLTPYNRVKRFTAAEPLQPCHSFCKEVLTLCGSYDPDRCDNFPVTDCFTIPPSSKKPCSSTNNCPNGEYCFFYSYTNGVCLQN